MVMSSAPCVPGSPIQLRNPFPYDFDVALISLNIVEAVGRGNLDTAKAPSLPGGGLGVVTVQHVMGKIWGRSAEVASM
jgi:hypothetical protein